VSKSGGVNGEMGIKQSDRVNWDMPIHLNEKNPKLMYLGTYRVYKNVKGFVPSWDSVSTDLTDGILTASSFHNISAIHSSAVDENIVYAGTSDANVWVSTDGSKTWQNVTGSLPNHYVSAIKASPNNKNTVFVTHTGYKLNNYIPHIHRSDNNGANWTDISGDLPVAAINDVFVWPGSDKILFVATDFGVYATNNGGVKWNRVGSNMPIIKCTDVEYNAKLKRLFVGTYARSMMSIEVADIVSSSTDLNVGSKLSIFPTLLHDYQFQISCDQWLGKSELYITDLSGRLIHKQSVDLVGGNNSISISPTAAGVYLVRIAQGKKSLVVQKIVIAKT
jgi:Secretion system C-terminal sorting domain